MIKDLEDYDCCIPTSVIKTINKTAVNSYRRHYPGKRNNNLPNKSTTQINNTSPKDPPRTLSNKQRDKDKLCLDTKFQGLPTKNNDYINNRKLNIKYFGLRHKQKQDSYNMNNSFHIKSGSEELGNSEGVKWGIRRKEKLNSLISTLNTSIKGNSQCKLNPSNSHIQNSSTERKRIDTSLRSVQSNSYESSIINHIQLLAAQANTSPTKLVQLSHTHYPLGKLERGERKSTKQRRHYSMLKKELLGLKVGRRTESKKKCEECKLLSRSAEELLALIKDGEGGQLPNILSNREETPMVPRKSPGVRDRDRDRESPIENMLKYMKDVSPPKSTMKSSKSIDLASNKISGVLTKDSDRGFEPLYSYRRIYEKCRGGGTQGKSILVNKWEETDGGFHNSILSSLIHESSLKTPLPRKLNPVIAFKHFYTARVNQLRQTALLSRNHHLDSILSVKSSKIMEDNIRNRKNALNAQNAHNTHHISRNSSMLGRSKSNIQNNHNNQNNHNSHNNHNNENINNRGKIHAYINLTAESMLGEKDEECIYVNKCAESGILKKPKHTPPDLEVDDLELQLPISSFPKSKSTPKYNSTNINTRGAVNANHWLFNRRKHKIRQLSLSASP